MSGDIDHRKLLMCVVDLRPEQADDEDSIHAVLVAAFETDAEAQLVAALRRGGDVVCSLVAIVDGQVAGQILFSRLLIHTSTRTIPSLSLAPLAVLPEFQRQGIGRALVHAGLQRVRELGEQSVIVLGHPDYYPQFGFSAELAAPLQSPFSGAAWMALELIPGALQGISGRVQYAAPFGILSD